MTREEAINWVESIKEKYIHGGDEAFDDARRKALDMAIEALSAERVIRCKDCRWGREACGNIEFFVDSNIPTEYHGYEWFCPNGERRTNYETN